MFQGKKIGVVVPTYNEEKLVGRVIETMPDFVDRIIVVDDRSPDGTTGVVQKYQENDSNLLLVRHEKNQGVGTKLVDAFCDWAKKKGVRDITLAVFPGNEDAVAFYDKKGFKTI